VCARAQQNFFINQRFKSLSFPDFLFQVIDIPVKRLDLNRRQLEISPDIFPQLPLFFGGVGVNYL
jgi:hypothetical protein